ncbi:MAG: nucleoside 2-deoxyribosyltransferase [Pseudoalteromonas sp.]|uniref:PfkB family carbohydrate kinase n=1 Tax=Pseudoalteromonas TaxID=53246 RepID=UPI001D863C11|nr:PfkB family carbohydrate kinase [Pseudoalteromonas sp.]NRA80682.1 nucleoside 2-deoxyribosyltransferase [Pseudoalteromonas sp.]
MNAGHITVVGGVYGEECGYPRITLTRGSGGRAAIFLASGGVSVTLNTHLGPQLEPEFRRLSETFKFQLNYTPAEHDFWFRYRHPLSSPRIFKLNKTSLSPRQKSPAVHTANAIVFGMLEGRTVLHGKKVVYDPQDGSNAKAFEINGSTAQSLAIVASISEGIALTGESEPEQIASKLLDRADVVIIKCGAQGAIVATNTRKQWISPFPSKRVFKIGSGDIFTASFGYAWLLKDVDPFDAAWFASCAVSKYVESGIDVISHALLERMLAESFQNKLSYSQKSIRAIPKTQIYLAGPFFNTAQQWLVDEARSILRDFGFNVFSPIHDVGEGDVNTVASADLKALQESGIVFAILDGLDPGTVFEIGYARALDIPVVVVAENVSASDLTMIIGSGCEVTDDFATAIYSTCWHLMGDV